MAIGSGATSCGLLGKRRLSTLHVLPEGFVKTRHYGLWASGKAQQALEVAHTLLQRQRERAAARGPPHLPRLSSPTSQPDCQASGVGHSGRWPRDSVADGRAKLNSTDMCHLFPSVELPDQCFY